MHFGLHLQRKGIISAEQFVAALEIQLKRVVPIGQLALEEGILSARQVFDVLRAQHVSPHERFGELAIEMGLMKRDDLMRLLMLQADRKTPLGEILIWQGILTRKQLTDELNEFRRLKTQPGHARTTTTVVRPPHRRSAGVPTAEPYIAI